MFSYPYKSASPEEIQLSYHSTKKIHQRQRTRQSKPLQALNGGVALTEGLCADMVSALSPLQGDEAMMMNVFWTIEGCLAIMLLYITGALVADYLNPYKIPWGSLAWPWTRKSDVKALDLLRTAISHRYGTDTGWATSSAWLEVTLALEGVRDIRLSSCATWRDLQQGLRKVIDNHPQTRVAEGLERALYRSERWYPRSCRQRLAVLSQEC